MAMTGWRQIGQSGGKEGLRFSRCDASPSRASAPLKPSISGAVDVSKSGPLTRSLRPATKYRKLKCPVQNEPLGTTPQTSGLTSCGNLSKG